MKISEFLNDFVGVRMFFNSQISKILSHLFLMKVKRMAESTSVLVFLKTISICFTFLISLSACSLNADIQSLSQKIDIENLNRKDPDFIHGEVVTSGRYQMTGVFGEISEKTKALNNSQWEFEGVFYE